MARLIIGHTNHDHCRVWVRGDRRYPIAHVSIEGSGNPPQPKPLELESRHAYTGVVEVKGLKADNNYSVEVEFARALGDTAHARAQFGNSSGTFRTFPASSDNAPSAFNFMLGSCNLHSLDDTSSDTAFAMMSQVAADKKARFMIHCGDQIYYDVPNPLKPADLDEYREKYLDAWADSRATRRFLTQFPQYMILDDHELENDFANDMKTSWFESPVKVIKEFGLKVYREYQHLHNPQTFDTQSLHYEFDYGNVRFFVLDTRTERFQNRPTLTDNQMINETQMRRLRAWLKKHKDAVKFVVTSVPFVGEVRDPGKDKWCSEEFRQQREGILEYIVREKIDGLTFLTGDMHNSYHATMELSAQDGSHKVVLHELMSSPINQLQKSGFDDYVTGIRKPASNGKINYLTKMKKDEFYCEHSNVMVIGVNKRKVSYEIFRTKRAESALKGKPYTV